MTGYALVRHQTPAGELTVSLRSVNHRGLDLHFHHIGELAIFENACRALLKQQILRGHVEVRLTFSKEEEAESVPPAYNRDLLRQYIVAFQRASREFALEGKPDLNALLRVNGIFDRSEKSSPIDASLEPLVVDALLDCARGLNDYREREGNELRSALDKEVDAIADQARRIAEIRKEALPYFHQRLRERLAELLNGVIVEDARLATEAALLADRSDIGEELTRLAIHTEELRRMLAEGGEVGKRLDFLLQEMNRETNTILSKTSGIGDSGLTITSLALATKANIEKIREQSLNLE
jgi:uncharacterized protein (TIGR00255 family)